MKRNVLHGRWAAALACALTLVVGCASYDLGTAMERALSRGSANGARPLDPDTIARGIREALRVGAENAADAASKPDGFQANPLIRLPMPAELDDAAQTLRRVGLGRQVDDFELALNRAAEAAASEAAGVFATAIRQMTLDDARQILNGPPTAATDYFRAKTTEDLKARFAPIVETKMNEVGLVKGYHDLMGRYMKLPLVQKPAFDLNRYVTDKTLDGLFTMLAAEETRIRTDPAARVTDLLRQVFGRPSAP